MLLGNKDKTFTPLFDLQRRITDFSRSIIFTTLFKVGPITQSFERITIRIR